MSLYQAKGNWNQIKGKIKKQWPLLNDSDVIEGEWDQLKGKITKAYGITVDQAEKQLNDFVKSINTNISDVSNKGVDIKARFEEKLDSVNKAVNEAVQQSGDKIKQSAKVAKETADEYVSTLTGYVKENPLLSVGVAALAGIGLAALLQIFNRSK